MGKNFGGVESVGVKLSLVKYNGGIVKKVITFLVLPQSSLGSSQTVGRRREDGR